MLDAEEFIRKNRLTFRTGSDPRLGAAGGVLSALGDRDHRRSPDADVQDEEVGESWVSADDLWPGLLFLGEWFFGASRGVDFSISLSPPGLCLGDSASGGPRSLFASW